MKRRRIKIVRKARVADCTRYGYVYWKPKKEKIWQEANLNSR